MSIQRKLTCPFLFLVITFSLAALVSVGPESSKAGEKKTDTVTGRIMIKDGGPLAWGQVVFYDASAGPPPAPDKYERTPDISRDLDAEGRFKVELPPGKYYLGAVKRFSGERFGPPHEGDYIFRSLDKDGKPREYVVKGGGFIDLGTISEAIALRAEDLAKRTSATAIEGVVFDMDGKVVDDAVVLAFVNQPMSGKPLFVSDKTGKDGKYILRLTPGTYYLRVRNSSAVGPPTPGQIVGYYGEGTPMAVMVREGERKKDINFRVILFPGRGPFSGTAPQKQ